MSKKLTKPAPSGHKYRRLSTSSKASSKPGPRKDEENNSKDCAICQEPVGSLNADGNLERWAVLPCGHLFGDRCLKEWLGLNAREPTCPTCRTKMLHNCGHPTLPVQFEAYSPPLKVKIQAFLRRWPAPQPFDPSQADFSMRLVHSEQLEKACAFCIKYTLPKNMFQHNRSIPIRALLTGTRPGALRRAMIRQHNSWQLDERRRRDDLGFSKWWGQQFPVTAPASLPTPEQLEMIQVQVALMAEASANQARIAAGEVAPGAAAAGSSRVEDSGIGPDERQSWEINRHPDLLPLGVGMTASEREAWDQAEAALILTFE